MKEILKDFYIPDGDTGGWITRHPTIDGMPGYAYEQIKTAVRTCGSRNGLAVDGGAHVGTWTVHLAKAFDQVIAFEPVPATFACLVKNTESMSNVINYHAALHSSCGHIGMKAHTGKSIGWRVNADPDIRVHCVSLDSFLSTDQRVDFIKLDLDGHELEAVRGAVEILKRDKPIVVIEEKLGESPKALQFLKDLGMVQIRSWKNDRLLVWR